MTSGRGTGTRAAGTGQSAEQPKVSGVPEQARELLPVIDFVAPMPGFPRDRRFVLIRMDDTAMLYSLTSLDTEGLRFLVVPPAPFFPDYAPEIDEATAADLCGSAAQPGVTAGSSAGGQPVDPAEIDPADLLVLLVVSAPTKAAEATVNLLAPIVLHQRTRLATQLVLTGSGYPVREPLLINRGPATPAPGASAASSAAAPSSSAATSSAATSFAPASPASVSAAPSAPSASAAPPAPSAPPVPPISPAAVAARIAASIAAKAAVRTESRPEARQAARTETVGG